MTGSRMRQRQWRLTNPPVPGTGRHDIMLKVKSTVESHKLPTALTKAQIAGLLGVTVTRAQGALLDLDRWDPTFVRSRPAPANGYKVVPGYTKASKQAHAHYLRDTATRLDSEANLLEKDAAYEGDASLRVLMENLARNLRTDAANLRAAASAI